MEDGRTVNILYEDNHLLIVEKKPNEPVQLDSSKDIDLQTKLKMYLKEKYHKPGNVYLGIVHRLDRPVGGIMVFAKTSKAASRLSESIRKQEITKIYHAIVIGNPKQKDTLKDKLLKNEKTNTTIIHPNGKEAILTYQKVETKQNLSLVKIELKTGRSHQIRVQFSSRGYPLYGDQRYNKEAKPGQQIALYATSLSLKHPITKKTQTFKINLPNSYPWNQFIEGSAK